MKRLVAELSLGKAMLQGVLAKMGALTHSCKRTLVTDLMQRYGASQQQACAVLRIFRSVWGYQSRARDARPLVARIKEIAATQVHYGYCRVRVPLRQEDWRDNCKVVYRFSRAEGLSLLHRRPRRHKSARLRQPKQLVRMKTAI